MLECGWVQRYCREGDGCSLCWLLAYPSGVVWVQVPLSPFLAEPAANFSTHFASAPWPCCSASGCRRSSVIAPTRGVISFSLCLSLPCLFVSTTGHCWALPAPKASALCSGSWLVGTEPRTPPRPQQGGMALARGAGHPALGSGSSALVWGFAPVLGQQPSLGPLEGRHGRSSLAMDLLCVTGCDTQDVTCCV